MGRERRKMGREGRHCIQEREREDIGARENLGLSRLKHRRMGKGKVGLGMAVRELRELMADVSVNNAERRERAVCTWCLFTGKSADGFPSTEDVMS